LAGFENVIERALEKHHPATPEIRDQIYNSARNALAGLLGQSDNLSPEAIFNQQQRLETAIAGIEARYAIVEPDYQDFEETFSEAPYDETPEYADAPDYATLEGYDSRPRRRFFSKILLIAILFAVFGIAAWWVYDQELLKPASERDTSVPNPPKIIESEDSPADKTAGANSGWITVFEPGDPRGLVTGGVATAELAKDNEGSYVRLKAPPGNGEAGVKFTVEPGVMETIRGKNAIFEIKVRTGSRKKHQFVVTCQFRQLGKCGRKRFAAGSALETFVFSTSLKDKVITGEPKSGFLSIKSDISGSGKALDLYLIRVSVE
jgi:hypothetical protein